MSPSSSPGRGSGTAPLRTGVFAAVVCLLAVTAAVVSFIRGSWLGVVWILLAGLSSNMAWYYLRKARARGRPADQGK